MAHIHNLQNGLILYNDNNLTYMVVRYNTKRHDSYEYKTECDLCKIDTHKVKTCKLDSLRSPIYTTGLRVFCEHPRTLP
jgi:hypothetical protein